MHVRNLLEILAVWIFVLCVDRCQLEHTSSPANSVDIGGQTDSVDSEADNTNRHTDDVNILSGNAVTFCVALCDFYCLQSATEVMFIIGKTKKN